VVTFVLVHGASHGPWCWELLVPELASRGHETVVVDLPVEDPDAGLEACVDSVARDVERHGGDPEGAQVLVGHSAAGMFLPLAAERIGAEGMVFVCGVVPCEGLSGRDQHREDPSMLTIPWDRILYDELGRYLPPPDVARAIYYNDCSDELASWACARLRPQSPRPMADPFPAVPWPDVPAASILCTDDRCVSPAWSRRVSLERLGMAAIEFPGGHSPFLSRPARLAGVLAEWAETALASPAPRASKH
jgi:pimeloyl-ACP methyl ester carboxylesterase